MRKKRYVVFAIAILVALSVAFAGHSIAAKKQFFAIATGGTGGTYYPLGGVLAQALTTKFPT